MDDIASILINTVLSKNDSMLLLPDNRKTVVKIHPQKYHTKRGWKKNKKLDNQNVHDVPFKQTDNITFSPETYLNQGHKFVCPRHT